MATSTSKTVPLRLGLALLVLASIGVTSCVSFSRAVGDGARVAHTQKVLQELEELLSAAREMVVGERTFVITADDHYATVLENALVELEEHQATLRQLTDDNPEQQARLDRLEPMVRRRVEFAQEVVRVRRESGFDVAQQRIQSGTGLRTSQSIRAILGELRDEEHRLLQRV